MWWGVTALADRASWCTGGESQEGTYRRGLQGRGQLPSPRLVVLRQVDSWPRRRYLWFCIWRWRAWDPRWGVTAPADRARWCTGGESQEGTYRRGRGHLPRPRQANSATYPSRQVPTSECMRPQLAHLIYTLCALVDHDRHWTNINICFGYILIKSTIIIIITIIHPKIINGIYSISIILVYDNCIYYYPHIFHFITIFISALNT